MTTANADRTWVRRHPITTALIAIAIVMIVLIGWAWLAPFSVAAPPPNPAPSYDAAASRIDAILAAETARGDVDPVCKTLLMTHGGETDRVIAFLHGFTSCPEQFRVLGQEFFDQGYNVYIPRLPHHGLTEQIDNDTYQITAEEMAGFAAETADIAQGLGRHVTVAGLSGGGTMAGWLAQNRQDLDVAMTMAPFFGIGFIPAVLNRPLTHVLVLLPPKFYLWWDPVRKANNPFTAPYAYPRYSLRALGEVLKLGYATESQAKKTRPGTSDIIVMSNANDDSVNNTIIDQFVQHWQAHKEDLLTTYRFDKALGLPHDLITPTRLDNRVDLVYPVIHELLDAQSQP